ncbi:UNVERIFIED_CONTAM: hypothetical protein GTU68_067470 [Idotea baltica]|nr:hypothetical protein [Idotea baltica]
MNHLNPQQKAAVLHVDTPVLVLAGAGSGKTGVITEKIAYLVIEKQYAPSSIIAVTFTNKAATEMRERLRKKLDAKAIRGLSISTFHRLGLNMLHKDGEHIGLRRGFTIMDQSDSMSALREIISEQNSAMEERTAQTIISNWKSTFITPGEALAESADDQTRVAALLYADYDRLLRACNSVDFDDLISLPVRLLRENPEVQTRWREKTRHMLIDEYQDTNAAQYEMIRLLVDKFGALTAVGDDDQSIYSWRGARPENLMNLKEDYPNLQVIKLEQNYRSSQRILRCANEVISHNPHVFEKKLWSALGIGDELRISVCRHGIDEAEWVVAEMMTQHFQKGRRFGDFAILYRSNFQSRVFEQALREKQISYAISGGKSFFDKAEIKDMLAYLKLLVNPDDDTAFLRCINTPRREIGPTTLAKLGEYARQSGSTLFSACHSMGLSESLSGKALHRLQRFANWLTLTADNAERGNPLDVVNSMFSDMDYSGWLERQCDTPQQAEKAIANTEEFLAWLGRMLVDDEGKDVPLSDAVSRLCLHDMLSRQEDDAGQDQVQLMTFHAAKGLEFPHVFMVGMEEEILPHSNSVDEGALEEERRLAYVGMTRARHTLTFTRARTRQKYGELTNCEPSRFLEDLPPDDVVTIGEPGSVDTGAQRVAGKQALQGLMDMLAED